MVTGAAVVAEPGWVTAMVARIAAGADGDADVLAQICRACAQGLPVSGAAISVMPAAAVWGGTGWASSEVGVRIEELHLTLGEGPYIEAFTIGRPVVVADLEVATRQIGWPVFAAAAVEAGVRAVFAFPLQLGAIRIGVLAFYRVTAGPLSDSERSEALIAAERATLVLLSAPGGADGDPDREPGWLDRSWVGRTEVHQATGMIAVQLGVCVEEAFLRLRAFAFAAGRPVTEVARDVVAQRVCFTEENR